MKKDDNTTNYSARLVCEKCGYVFGLKEVAYIEHGFSEPWASPKIETKCCNEIYPKYCPKCKREAQHISYGVKLDAYCAKDEEEADIAIKKRKEEDIQNCIEKIERYKEHNKLKTYSVSVTPAPVTGVLAYCNGDVNATKFCEIEKSVACVTTPLRYDCEAVKITCPWNKCPEKNAVSPKYFEKNGFYICAVFYTLSNANEFAKYLFHRTNNGRSDNISLLTISSAISRNNGYARMHKAGSFESIGAIPRTNEGRCGWSRKELKEYGIAIDFEKHPNTNEDIFCVYLPVPKYFGDKKEASK